MRSNRPRPSQQQLEWFSWFCPVMLGKNGGLACWHHSSGSCAGQLSTLRNTSSMCVQSGTKIFNSTRPRARCQLLHGTKEAWSSTIVRWDEAVYTVGPPASWLHTLFTRLPKKFPRANNKIPKILQTRVCCRETVFASSSSFSASSNMCLVYDILMSNMVAVQDDDGRTRDGEHFLGSRKKYVFIVDNQFSFVEALDRGTLPRLWITLPGEKKKLPTSGRSHAFRRQKTMCFLLSWNLPCKHGSPLCGCSIQKGWSCNGWPYVPDQRSAPRSNSHIQWPWRERKGVHFGAPRCRIKQMGIQHFWAFIDSRWQCLRFGTPCFLWTAPGRPGVERHCRARFPG